MNFVLEFFPAEAVMASYCWNPLGERVCSLEKARGWSCSFYYSAMPAFRCVGVSKLGGLAGLRCFSRCNLGCLVLRSFVHCSGMAEDGCSRGCVQLFQVDPWSKDCEYTYGASAEKRQHGSKVVFDTGLPRCLISVVTFPYSQCAAVG